VDGNLPLANVTTLERIYEKSLARTSFTLVLLAIAGAMAMLIGLVGIYGVISYSVTQRTREIGIRMALGAGKGQIFRLVLRQGFGLTLTGLAVGLALALALTRLLKSALYGVGATDTLTFASVAVLLSAVALAACYIPARRATKIEPTVALRCE
jgi:ABC-type antimicrobial peptide transport system permease subunit